MKLGIIIQTNEAEKAWNGVRFGNASISQGHNVKLFLMSAGVEIESLNQGKFNAKQQLDEFTRQGGKVMACGTCIKLRHQSESETCPLSTMIDCVSMVEWADKVVTF